MPVKCIDNKCPRYRDCDRAKGTVTEKHIGEKCTIIIDDNGRTKQFGHDVRY
jgi:hypothetical protein